MRRLSALLAPSLLIPALLAGCGTLPEPFFGNPGKTGAALAMPPPPELVVLPPAHAGLPDAAAARFAASLSADLVANDVPSLAHPTPVPQWQLHITTATAGAAAGAGGQIVPSYAVIGPDKKTYGTLAGTPAPAAAWQAGDAKTLDATAAADAPRLASLLAVINAKVQQGNPQSLENRTPLVFVNAGTGAPGDGNTSLPFDLRRDLPRTGLKVVDKQAGADFTVIPFVKATPQPNGTLLVELDWKLYDSNSRDIGQVTQLHELKPSDIEPYWGDVAAAAADQAADGIREAIGRAVPARTPPAAAAAPTTAQPAAAHPAGSAATPKAPLKAKAAAKHGA